MKSSFYFISHSLKKAVSFHLYCKRFLSALGFFFRFWQYPMVLKGYLVHFSQIKWAAEIKLGAEKKEILLPRKMFCPFALFLFYLIQYLCESLKVNSGSFFFFGNYLKRAYRDHLFWRVQGVKGIISNIFFFKKPLK